MSLCLPSGRLLSSRKCGRPPPARLATTDKATATQTTEPSTVSEDSSSQSDFVANVNALETSVTSYKQDLDRTLEDTNLNETQREEAVEEFGNKVIQEAGEALAPKDMPQALGGEDSAVAFTNLQDMVNNASITIATLFTNYTKNFTNGNLHMQVSSKPLSYYSKPEARRFDTPYSGTSVELPEELYKDGVGEDGSVRVVIVSYETLPNINNTIPPEPGADSKEDFAVKDQLGSNIISITVVGTEDWRSVKGQHVRLNFSHVYGGDHFTTSNPRCVWWDKRGLAWNTTGCFSGINSDNFTECSCNHMTSFSLLMDVWGRRENLRSMEGQGYEAARWLGTAGCVASWLCLALCLAVIVALKPLRTTLCWRIRGQLCLSLLLAYSLVLVSTSVGGKGAWWCKAIGALLHYSLLCVFSWGAIEGFNMYLMFVKVWRTQRRLLRYYLGAGFGFPVVVVGLTLAVTRGQGYRTEGICWLASGAVLWSFVGPMVVILTMNFLIFVLVIRILIRNIKERKRALRKRDSDLKDRLWGSTVIFFNLGFSWATGVLHLVFDATFSAILFSITASSQGVWIFVFGILLNKKIRGDMKRLLIPAKDDYGVSLNVIQNSKQETENYKVTIFATSTEE
ncbi:latrophilin-like protein LAT-2 isoform X1 [Penaeus indicus]|uniref:latrophilin-like protein LAT-2 isoform X1 n=1 Tax=Penaeus indicus TaxID=29960 RepID=UPI00300CA17F